MNHSYPYYPCYGHPWYQWTYYAVPYYATPYHGMYCTTCCQPAHLCQCARPLTSMKLPQELVADATTTSNQIFIGGTENVSLSLEYMPSGTSPSVKVTITENGSTSTWDITTIPDEYQVKENFATVSPGAQVTLDVVDCTARLRWCEVVCC